MNIKDQIRMSAGASKETIINESALDDEKRKIQIKIRALNLVSSTLGDIENIKREIERPYVYNQYGYPNYGGAVQQEPPVATAKPEEVAGLKRMVYKILKEKFSAVEEMIEREFGTSQEKEKEEE